MEIAENTIIAKKYRIEKKLGEGATSVVYKAEDIDLHKPMAVKFLREELAALPSRRKLFLQEAKIVASFHHPGIVPIRAAGEWQRTLYLVLDYYDGGSLKDLLAQRPLTLKEVQSLSFQLLDALSEAHRHNFIHGDVKPHNVMLKREDQKLQVGLVDFGLARYADEGKSLAGTLLYMAPEQHLGDSVDQRSDLYSAALCIYQMLTGKIPFFGATGDHILYKILQEDLPKPSQIKPLPRIWDKVMSKALAVDREARYQNAQEFKQALEIAFRTRRFLPGRRLTYYLIAACIVSIFFFLLHFSLFSAKTETRSEEERVLLWQEWEKKWQQAWEKGESETAKALLADPLFSAPEGKIFYHYFVVGGAREKIRKALEERDYEQAKEIVEKTRLFLKGK